MTELKDLHLQDTVKAAVEYIVGDDGNFAYLRMCFNRLCEDWHADEFDPDDLSLDINEITLRIADEPWIKDIAALPDHERTWQMTERVVEEFIHKYWMMPKEEITTKNVADVLRVADPLSKRHIIAQRVVIESISKFRGIHTCEELKRLDRLMDDLATNPRLER